MSEPPIDYSESLPAQPPSRRPPHLRIYQPSPRQLRLDFAGDIDQWSEPLLNAAEMAAGSAPRADVLIDLGGVTALHEIALSTFSSIHRHTADQGTSMTFLRVSEAALRTFDLYRYEDWHRG
ncbi:STAS domain-containing protein [Cryptosporangium minutisporangium]|uniref:STAS domain-containing protein n=1 Tax=Cryptosporangium minutisporangium TaxID=113569 RepID=A0ABP6TBI8_9ACTN